MKMDLLNYLPGGKNSKFRYYVSAYAALCIPRFILRASRRHALAKASGRKDWVEIENRLNYYNRIDSDAPFRTDAFKEKSVALGQQKKVQIRSERAALRLVLSLTDHRPYAKISLKIGLTRAGFGPASGSVQSGNN